MLWATFEHLSNTPVAQYTYNKAGGGTNTVPQNTTGNWIFCASGAVNPANETHIRIGDDGHLVGVGGPTIRPVNITHTIPRSLMGNIVSLCT